MDSSTGEKKPKKHKKRKKRKIKLWPYLKLSHVAFCACGTVGVPFFLRFLCISRFLRFLRFSGLDLNAQVLGNGSITAHV